MRPVAITGCALGLPARPGDPASLVFPGAGDAHQGPVPADTLLRDGVPARTRRRLSRSSLMVLGSAMAALEDAGALDPDLRLGLASVLGTSYGEISGSCRMFEDGLGPGMSPTLFHNSVHNAPLGYLAIVSGIRGPSLTLSDSTLSGEEALAEALAMIGDGTVKGAIAGSGDESCPSFFSPCWREGEDAPRSTARRTESGGRLVTDEGYGFVVLEREDLATSRGARTRALVDCVSQAGTIGEAVAGALGQGPADAIIAPAGLDRHVDGAAMAAIRDVAGPDARIVTEGSRCGYVPASGVIRCVMAVGMLEGGASRIVTAGADVDGAAIAIGISRHGGGR